jgi:hypothetical protein
VLADYVETNKWPWDKEGWIWIWERWMWSGTVHGEESDASTNTSTSPLLLTTPFAVEALHQDPAPKSSSVRDKGKSTVTKTNDIPPATAFIRPIIIPPTPQLPRSFQPTVMPPPTPAQLHKSGIMGESPMPPRFKHFSGNGFADKYARLQAVVDWSDGIERTGPGKRAAHLRSESQEKVVMTKKDMNGKEDKVGSVDLLDVPELIPDD